MKKEQMDAACQEVVRILLDKPEFVLKEVKAQYSIRNVENPEYQEKLYEEYGL